MKESSPTGQVLYDSSSGAVGGFQNIPKTQQSKEENSVCKQSVSIGIDIYNRGCQGSINNP